MLSERGRITRKLAPLFGKFAAILLLMMASYLAFLAYLGGLKLFGVLILILGVIAFGVFSKARLTPLRFIFPGLLTITLFILFPIFFTIYLGFTNYSSFNILSHERAIKVLQLERIIDQQSARDFHLLAEGEEFRIVLEDGEGALISEPVTLHADMPEQSLAMRPASLAPTEKLPLKEIVAHRGALAGLTLILPDGRALRLSGLRQFANITPLYERLEGDILRNSQTGETLTPDHARGFYVDEAGEAIPPGWRVAIGVENFTTIARTKGIRAPMFGIFLWTFAFAALSVLSTFIIGVTLASILNWPHLRAKSIYRVLLILPYAVPSFISILIFRGLFNPNFGEINMILDALFGARPEWLTNPWLARLMLLIVNSWLGYPYMMLLAMGFLQSVPQDQKKSAALDGASSLRSFFAITLPQILPPFLPLLLASFAFNFNNLVLVLLLTRGLPNIPGTMVPAGQTDIMASFMYRIAFEDSGQQFGLASAITFLIFIIVTIIAYGNFLMLRRRARPGLGG